MKIRLEIKLPVLLRTTTRLNHVRGSIELQKIQKPRGKGHFEKDPMLVTVPAIARLQHPILLEKIKKAEEISEKSKFGFCLQN